MNQTSSYSRADLLESYPALLAGLALLTLLPIGILVGINQPLFDYFGLVHFVFHITALLLGVVALVRIAHKAAWTPFLSLGVVAIFVAIVAVQSLPPPIARDALVHHLAVPNWWLKAGLIDQIPWHDWSYYPMLLNLAYTLFLKFNAEWLIPFYHGSYLFLCATFVLSFVFRLTKSADLALSSFLLCATIPAALKLAATPLVDLGLAFYSGLAVILAVDWVRSSGKFSALLGCGLALGLALGTKYNAMLATFSILLFLPLYALRGKISFTRAIASTIFVGLVALIVFSPWLIKNALWTLNPVYPLYKGFFGTAGAAASGAVGLKPLQLRMLQYGESWWELMLIPFRMILFGQDGNPRQFDGVLSPALLVAFFALLRVRKSSTIMYLALISFAYCGLALLYSPARIRYMAPLLMPICALCAFGIDGIRELLHLKSRKDVATLVIAIQIAFALFQSWVSIKKSEALEYAVNHPTREEYLAQHVPVYPLVQVVNQQLAPTDCVFLAYTGNEFYLFQKCVRGHYDSGKVIINWLATVDSAKALAEKFRAAGTNHLLAHRTRLTSTLEDMLTQDKKIIWNQFEKEYLEPLQTVGQYSLWKIKSSAEIKAS